MPDFLTVTICSPAGTLGTITLISLSLLEDTDARVEPKKTSIVPSKPVPEIVTSLSCLPATDTISPIRGDVP